MIEGDVNLTTNFNLSLIDPAKWGWSAGGKVVQLLTPHEKLKRRCRRARVRFASKTRRAATSTAAQAVSVVDQESNRNSNTNSANSANSTSSSVKDNCVDKPNQLEEHDHEHYQEQHLFPSDRDTEPTPLIMSRSPFSEEIWKRIRLGVKAGCDVCKVECRTGKPDSRRQRHASDCPRLRFKHKIQMKRTTPPPTQRDPRPIKRSRPQQDECLHTLSSDEGTDDQASPGRCRSGCPEASSKSSYIESVMDTTNHASGSKPPVEQADGRAPSEDCVELDFKSVRLVNGKTNHLSVTSLVPREKPAVDDTALSEVGNDNPIIDEDNIFVDMYTYHLGREGLELCDEPDPVDTGWNAPLPINRFEIQIEFPLNDDRSEMWKERIEWDLEDERTQSPMAFATQIAHDFGLSFVDTMELVTSIEDQLNTMRRDFSVGYPDTVIQFIDPVTGQYRSTIPQIYYKSRPCHLYGWSSSEARDIGGMPVKARKGSKPCAVLPPPVAAIAPIRGTKPSAFEEERYHFKTSAPFREEVVRRAKEAFQFSSTIVQTGGNHVCHLCDAKKYQSVLFPCENPSHAYCHDHLKSELKLDLYRGSGSRSRIIAFCPICCCCCPCINCSKRLDQVAQELKRLSDANGGSSPRETKLDHILLYCSGKIRPNCISTEIFSVVDGHRLVPKVPLSDFPREMCGARDLEPGTEIDYRTVFRYEGTYLLEPFNPIFSSARSRSESAGAANATDLKQAPEEDGNVGYCLICNRAGNMICCDFCPRAFHARCMEVAEAVPNRDVGYGFGRWECPTCKREKEGLPEDLITGRAKFRHDEGIDKNCLAAVCEAFATVVGRTMEEDIHAMKVLSILLNMVQHLMDYDFGCTFQEPVDVQAIPEYETIIEKPMDLGTIANSLVDGSYAKLFDVKKKDWGTVFAQVLKDVELVWHNCYTFNVEGSAICRMAEVCSRRARNIFTKSLENLIGDAVKQEVAEFVKECDHKRASISTLLPSSSHIMPNSKYKISVQWAPAGKSRVVAIVDPDTGRLCKLYSSMKSALAAAYFLSAIDHEVEWPSISDYTIRNWIKLSRDDLEVTLFGYRWLYYDDLCSGEAVFGQQSEYISPRDRNWLFRQPDDCIIQMTDSDDITYLFSSIAEAVSFDGLSKDTPLAKLKSRLEEGPVNEWISLAGVKWRKVAKADRAGTQISLGSARLDLLTHESAAVVKQDMISGQQSIDFDSIDAALKDWRLVCRNSLAACRKFELSLSVFETLFLYGNSNVDGLVWKVPSMISNARGALKSAQYQHDAIIAVATELEKQPRQHSM